MFQFQGCGCEVGCEVRLILGAMDAKDPVTANHSERVALLAKELAMKMDLPEEMVQEIYLAGLLHDVGKLAIPASVLFKPGRLEQAEMEMIRRHPGLGERLMSCIKLTDTVMRGIVEHHERPDGKGYPNSLNGPALSMAGKLLKVADVFDALCSERPYKSPITPDEAYRILADGAGREFDSHIIAALLRNPFSPALL